MKLSGKVPASRTVLITILEPNGDELTPHTYITPIVHVHIIGDHQMVIDLEGMQLPDHFYTRKQPCKVFLSYTDDPYPEHAFQVGSLGYSRVRFRADEAIIKRTEDCVVVEAQKIEVDITCPER